MHKVMDIASLSQVCLGRTLDSSWRAGTFHEMRDNACSVNWVFESPFIKERLNATKVQLELKLFWMNQDTYQMVAIQDLSWIWEYTCNLYKNPVQ